MQRFGYTVGIGSGKYRACGSLRKRGINSGRISKIVLTCSLAMIGPYGTRAFRSQLLALETSVVPDGSDAVAGIGTIYGRLCAVESRMPMPIGTSLIVGLRPRSG